MEQHDPTGVLGKWRFNNLPLRPWKKTKHGFERRRRLRDLPLPGRPRLCHAESSVGPWLPGQWNVPPLLLRRARPERLQRAGPAQSRSSCGRNQVLRRSRILAQSRRGGAYTAAQCLGRTSRSALAQRDDRVVAEHRCAEQEPALRGDSIVACDVFLPTRKGMKLYVRDRRTKMAHFLRLTDKRREHTHSPLRVKQYASRSSSPQSCLRRIGTLMTRAD